jgi:hypothetical protein
MPCCTKYGIGCGDSESLGTPLDPSELSSSSESPDRASSRNDTVSAGARLDNPSALNKSWKTVALQEYDVKVIPI